MITRSFAIAGFLASTIVTQAVPPPVGSVSDNLEFALNNGGGFADTDLSAYDGKILVLMLMTPW